MTLTLPPGLAAAVTAAVQRDGQPPEVVALTALWERFPPPPFEPQDEWERRLFSLGTDCGVALTDEQLSREHMYD